MIDDRIGVGFAGCGAISRLYTDIYAGLSDVARVVAVADPQPERAAHRRARQVEAYLAASHAARLRAGEARDDETRAAELRKAELAQSAAADIRVYRSHEGLLRDDEVRAMVLLTTPTVRAEPTIAAAEAGRHVFTQGPMAASVADAAAMADAVRQAGVKFHSQCGARYPRGIALARRAVEKSLLGEIASARVELNWFRPQGYYQGWHGTWDGEGGGAAFHHGRYIIDPFLWVLGSRVVELFAYAGPALREIEHENLTHAAVRYSNGATGTIHASLLNHKQRLTPSGPVRDTGSGRVDAGRRRVPQPGQPGLKLLEGRHDVRIRGRGRGGRAGIARRRRVGRARAGLGGVPEQAVPGEHRQRLGPGRARSRCRCTT